MTTKQTIDGVPRDRLELCVKALASTGYTFESNELRAMLDAPAKPVPSCIGDLERFESDGEDFVKVGDVIDMMGNMKAAQPQGEPAHQCQKCNGRGTMSTRHAGEGETDYRARCKLYAEQPAPVAVVLPHPKVVSMIVTRAARQADLTPGANYHTAAELAADAILFEVAALNLK